MAKKNDKTELPKNVPIIKVRQQFITKCGTTCAGQGHEREKRWPPCGPSPPVSVGSNVTCGLPDCYDEETCRCRCPCTLKEMMRMAAEPPSAQETPATQQSVQTVPQMHLARIYTLEPKLQNAALQTYPITQLQNGEMVNGFKIQYNGRPTAPTLDQVAEQPEGHAAAADQAPDQNRNGGGVTTRRPDPLDSGPKKKMSEGRPEEAKQMPAGGNDTEREGGAAKKYRVPKTSGYQRWLPHWWYIFGGAPPEPCRGGHCFFGSPARTFNTTAEVLGELPEWNLEPIRRVCRSCMGGSKKMYCPRRKSSLTGRKPDLKKGVERICR